MTRDAIILIGDRDAAITVRLCGLLRQQKHPVQVVSSATRALDFIESHSPALVVVATDAYDMGRFECCRRVRLQRRGRRIPLLLVTRDEREQAEGFRLGMSDYISDPLRPAEVLARVNAQLTPARLRLDARTRIVPRDAVFPGPDEEAWTRVVMEAGRMFAFVWNTRPDEISRTGDYAKILGVEGDTKRQTRADFLGTVHPNDRKQLEHIFTILSPAFDSYSMQYRICRGDGETVFLRESGRGYFDPSGRLAHVRGVVIDVTEQTEAQKELERSQAGILQLIDSLPVAVALTGSEGRIEYINQRFKRVFGYGLEDVADLDAWWLRARLDEHCRQENGADGVSAADAAGVHGENAPPRRYRVTDKRGAEHLVEMSASVIGNCKFILFDDVTERARAESTLRESEETFRGMADTAPVMLWVAGPDKRCTFFNKGWLSFTGRAMEQELGNGWADGVHPEDLDRCLRTYETAFDAREGFQMEYRLRRADGEFRWILDSGNPRFSQDATFAGYIGSAIDITESKRNQERLLVTQKLQSVGLLAGGVVHDINNFLGSILASTDRSLSELGIHSRTRRGLQEIETIAHRALEIARQVMIYTGQTPQEIETVDVARLIRDMLQLLRVCIPKDADLNVDLPASLFLARANAPQLRQVIMNLVLNAGEAIGGQSGAITITGRQDPKLAVSRANGNPAAVPTGEFVRLEVSDNGKGMTDDIRRRIFDPFFTTKVSGRGLGLAAVREIVRSHGGNIEVTSIPGKGTSFQIFLPCNAHPAEESGEPRSFTKGAPPRPGSILIVEDEETLRISVATMLRKRGFSVLEASDGNFASEVIRERNQNIAVVLLDLTLPGKSSQEVFEELRHHRPGVKVILTSAYGLENIVGPLKALKSADFIRKPYQLNELVTAVSQVLPSERPVSGKVQQVGSSK